MCVKNCTCPADGSACSLSSDCGLKIAIHGGGCGGRGAGRGVTLFLLALTLGGAAAFGYVHYRGIPAWLPIRERGYASMGLYNELSEHGI